MSNELKPCPICQSRAHPVATYDEDGMMWHFIKCDVCGLRTRGKWVSSPSNVCPIYLGEVRDQWNTRTDATKDAEIKRLREALEMMLGAVCGETGFVECVRRDSGTAYPWPALDIAEDAARAALSPIPDPAGGMPVEVETDDRAEDYVKHGLREEDLP